MSPFEIKREAYEALAAVAYVRMMAEFEKTAIECEWMWRSK